MTHARCPLPRSSRHPDRGAIRTHAGSGRGARQGRANGICLPILAPRGTIIVVGIHENMFDFNPTTLLTQEASVVGSLVYSDDDYHATTCTDEFRPFRRTCGWSRVPPP